MSDTIRELIIQDFLTRGAVVTVAGGYQTDIGTNVQRCRKEPEAPCFNVWAQVEASGKKYGVQNNVMPVLIEGSVAYGLLDPSVVAERLLGDIIKAVMGRDWERSPDYIDSIDYVSGGTENFPDAEDKIVGASALFQVAYKTKIGDPYTFGG